MLVFDTLFLAILFENNITLRASSNRRRDGSVRAQDAEGRRRATRLPRGKPRKPRRRRITLIIVILCHKNKIIGSLHHKTPNLYHNVIWNFSLVYEPVWSVVELTLLRFFELQSLRKIFEHRPSGLSLYSQIYVRICGWRSIGNSLTLHKRPCDEQYIFQEQKVLSMQKNIVHLLGIENWAQNSKSGLSTMILGLTLCRRVIDAP